MISPSNFKLIVDCCCWAAKHTERVASEEGLNTLIEMVRLVGMHQAAQTFYQAYFVSLLQDVLFVLTDTFHKSGMIYHRHLHVILGFKEQSTLLLQLFMLVQSGQVTVPLWPPNANYPNNSVFLQEFVVGLLADAFRNLARYVINF